MLIKNGFVFTKNFQFEKKDILIKDGKICEISDAIDESNLRSTEEIVDASGFRIIPGLTDIHFHGCVGYDFCDGTDEAIRNMAKFQLTKGVTNICPATMTLSSETLKKICSVAAHHNASGDEAVLCGINLEGPCISPDRCGAQNPEYVHKPDIEFLKELIEESNSLTKLVTIAPEVQGAIECIKSLKDKIRFSVGHTMANYDEAKAAFDAGARHVTHLFNAMPGLTHREPGVIGAAVENEDVMAEIICDGIHIHPSAIRAAFQLFGDDRIILISDSTRACGMEEGEYELGGLPVFLKDGAVRLEDGTLAGSATNVYDCMVNVIKMGIPENSAIKAATYNPAKAIGILDECGTLEKGKAARMVLIDDNYQIKRVIKE